MLTSQLSHTTVLQRLGPVKFPSDCSLNHSHLWRLPGGGVLQRGKKHLLSYRRRDFWASVNQKLYAAFFLKQSYWVYMLLPNSLRHHPFIFHAVYCGPLTWSFFTPSTLSLWMVKRFICPGGEPWMKERSSESTFVIQMMLKDVSTILYFTDHPLLWLLSNLHLAWPEDHFQWFSNENIHLCYREKNAWQDGNSLIY